VQRYDDAWANADCAALEESTTEAFRTSQGFDDCAAFQEDANQLNAVVDNYVVSVTDVSSESETTIVVTTSETFDQITDDNGDPQDPVPGEFAYVYTVIDEGGVWLIDGIAEG
jgi:hypothetical protein